MLENPICIQEVRVGLGLCYFELGRESLAKKWFQRVLDLDSNNVEALLGMAIIEFNKPDLKGRKKEGYKFIVKAYQSNPSHPRVLNYLSRYFFHRRDYTKAEEFADEAYKLAKSPLIKAESQYLQGRILQARRAFDLAMRKFEYVLKIWPDHTLARHGLAQMYIYRENTNKAIDQLKKLYKMHPYSAEIPKFLGSLYAKQQQIELKDEAGKLLEKVVVQIPNDWEAWIELAQVKESTKITQSLNAYESALNELKNNLVISNQCSSINEAEKLIPSELWNNLGALRHRCKKYEESEIAYINSISSNGHTIKEFRIENISSTYNLARLYEDTNRKREAILLYTSILKEHPNLIECYLRLASIASSKRNIDEANKWIRCAFEIDINNIDAWSLAGNLYFKEKDWQKSQQKFEHILEQIDKKDNYSILSLANIYFYATNDQKISKERASKFIKTAGDFYKRALLSQPNNLSAINGVACIIAYKDEKLDDAHNLFLQVRENSFDPVISSQSWINIAHILLKQGKYSSAVQLYTKCLKKFYNNCNKELLLYISNCYFCSSQLLECKRTILEAIHIDPIDTTLWFNLALTQSKYAVLVSKKKKNATVIETKSAITETEQAIKIFNNLIEKAKDPNFKRKYSSTSCKDELKYCESLLKNLQRLLNDLEILEKEFNERKKQRQILAEEARKKLEFVDAERLRKKQETAEKIRIEAEINEKHRRELQQQWAEKKRQRDIINDEDEPPTKRKKKKKSSTVHQEESSSDNEGEFMENIPQIEDESVDDMRNRRGGHLNNLLESMEQEEQSRKAKIIEDIHAINAEPEKDSIKESLEEIFSDISKDEMVSWKFKQLGNALIKAGIKKSIVKKHKEFVISTAAEIIRGYVNQE